MSRHRAAPPPLRAAAPLSRHRAGPARPRYGRIAVLGSSIAVTAVAMLGGTGVLPSVAQDGPASTVVEDATPSGKLVSNVGPQTLQVQEPAQSEPAQSEPAQSEQAQSEQAQSEQAQSEPAQSAGPEPDPSVPTDSGEGRRVVFSEDAQRVWLVGDDGTVERTYLVSGSASDNLNPGTYSVFSRSEQATGVDGSGMQWFVRFTEGDNGGAIGFHDIPVDDGAPVQTLDQLGTPLSHGCIRQKTDDAVALWDFAPIGTEVVVV